MLNLLYFLKILGPCECDIENVAANVDVNNDGNVNVEVHEVNHLIYYLRN